MNSRKMYAHYSSLFLGASFSEHFYGLKRISAVKLNTQTIAFQEKKLCFILLVILPYLKIKIEEKLTQYRFELADGVLLNVIFFFKLYKGIVIYIFLLISELEKKIKEFSMPLSQFSSHFIQFLDYFTIYKIYVGIYRYPNT